MHRSSAEAIEQCAFPSSILDTQLVDLAYHFSEGGIWSKTLNAELLTRLQKGGEAFLSNAVIGGTFVLRACIVNFSTSIENIEALPDIVILIGREVDDALRLAEPLSE